jgi:uncharacterized protein YraI
MEEMKSLSLDDMEKVAGGVAKTVVSSGGAVVRSGAGKNYPSVGTLANGTTVNITGTTSYNNDENISWYYINSPVSGWLMRHELNI